MIDRDIQNNVLRISSFIKSRINGDLPFGSFF